MAKTGYIENIENCGSLDTDLNDLDGHNIQDETLRTIVLLDGENGSGPFIKDDVEITYYRKYQNGEKTQYEDGDGNPGYKYIFEFGQSDFAGTISTVCMAGNDFRDPRFTRVNFSEESIITGSASEYGGYYRFTNSDTLNNATRIINIDYENGELLTFTPFYSNGEWTFSLAKWHHNFRNFRIGGAQCYIWLKEVTSIDVDDLISIPDNQGNWSVYTDSYGQAMLNFGIDEKNNRYVFVFMHKAKKVLNTLIVQKDDLTQTSLHQMVLPNEANWASNMNWNYFTTLRQTPRYIPLYKGKICFLFDTVRTEQEQEISGVYMCSINPEDSTDITALETHFINNSWQEEEYNTHSAYMTYQPLYNSDCGSFISDLWVIKNDKAYVKRHWNDNKDYGFYYKGMMLSTYIYDNKILFKWRNCPFCLSLAEVLSKPFFKTLNKTLKYTFRIVNTGGSWYGL